MHFSARNRAFKEPENCLPCHPNVKCPCPLQRIGSASEAPEKCFECAATGVLNPSFGVKKHPASNRKVQLKLRQRAVKTSSALALTWPLPQCERGLIHVGYGCTLQYGTSHQP